MLFAYLPGTGYEDDQGEATFPDGRDWVDVPVDPTGQYDDADHEGDETVVIRLDAGSGGYGLDSHS